MNLAELLRDLFSPCPHEWERVMVLKDREENPSSVTLVLACRVCGKTRQEVFSAPKGDGCPPHRWMTTRKIGVLGPGAKKGDLPRYYDHEQECQKCGDVRVKRL